MRLASLLPLALLSVAAACADAPSGPLTPADARLAKGAGGGGSPHFLYVDYTVASGDPDLELSFKQAGLGSFQSIAYSLTADFSGSVQCYNRAGNEPQGDPHDYDVTGLNASGNFPVRNGSVTGQLVLEAPAMPDLCRKPHYPVLLSATWSSIVFTWGDGNAGPTPGTLSAGQSASY